VNWRQAGAVTAGAGAIAGGGIMLGAGPGPAAPLAATLALVVATPAAPAARPRALLAGYALSALAGVLASAALSPATDPSLHAIGAIALGAGLAVALMARFDALHPPAAAAGCVVALQPVLHWPVALVVLTGGAVVAGAAAARARRLHTDSRRRTPTAVGVPAPKSVCDGSGVRSADQDLGDR
jgi:CBS-domain-containing membrane protein